MLYFRLPEKREEAETPQVHLRAGGRFPVDQRERGGGVSLRGRQTDEWKKREQLRISNEEMLKSIKKKNCTAGY